MSNTFQTTKESSKPEGGSSDSSTLADARTTTQSRAPETGHKFLDIWETGSEWRAQMVNYIGHFKTKEHAEKFVNAVRVFRKSQGELK